MDLPEDIDQIEDSPTKDKEDMELDNEDVSPADETVNKSANDSSTSKNVSLNNSYSSEDMLKNHTWELGQLAWARMSTYPYWPCMITNDPNSMMTYQKVQTVGKSKTLMIHVHFFNDNGRHSWIPSHHMIPFEGIEDFRKRASLITDEIRKKEPKFAAALTIKPNLFGTWQKAVAEAMDVLYELDLTPLEMFKPQKKEIKNKVPKSSGGVGRKRKRKEEDNAGMKKIFKTAELENEVKITTDVKNTEVENNNLNLETPPVSPPNEDDMRAATLQKQKRITKMINKLQPPDFEVYFERNFYTIKEQHSDTTDEQVREYLYDVWESMGPEEKLKYRATYRIENDS